MTVAYVSHSDCGRHDTGWNHPEHVGRLRAIPRALRYDFDLFDTIEHREGRHATVEELALAHDRAYVERVRALPGVRDWIDGALAEKDFIDFEEPYRLRP